ncbi:MAG: hypothetical protein WD844_01145 [Thermoleophilaceae bacterium]
MISNDEASVVIAGETELAIRRATYFEAIADPSGAWSMTEQAAVEMAHLDLRDAQRTRQATRYGPHGIHEYKGKFNPQVVRALCNVIDGDADVLIDPFCGSGTSLVEGLRLGMDVLGIDHSPIACFIAEAKLRAISSPSKAALAEELLALAERCADSIDVGQASGRATDLRPSLGNNAVTYLQKWFTPAAYAGLAGALATLDGRRDSAAGRLALVALSSILRDISLQLPEDLRVRRRPEPYTAPPLTPLFMDAIDRTRRGLLEMEDWPETSSEWAVHHGSAEATEAFAAAGSGRRLVITSPPYATALPYIDTDRLSVVALGLADSAQLLELERSLIGSREWTRAEQLEWDTCRLENRCALPPAVTAVAAGIAELNEGGDAGFRRKAVASLLYRYFARMGNTIERWHEVLGPGESAVLIVGHNHTTAGGQKIPIPTPELLGHVAEARGFDVSEIIKLETWPRYGLHSANGVAGEDALVLRRPRD